MNTPWRLREAMSVYRPGEWIYDALCAQIGGTDFFPGKSESAEPAKRICRMCSVRTECGLYAINSPSPLHGIWGGMSLMERREIRRTKGIKDQDFIEDWHGTDAGARRHYREGSAVCSECRVAANEAQRMRVERKRVAQ